MKRIRRASVCIPRAPSFPVSTSAKNFPIERSPKKSAASPLKSHDGINNAGQVSPTPQRPLLKPSFSLLSSEICSHRPQRSCLIVVGAARGALRCCPRACPVQHVVATCNHASSVHSQRVAARSVGAIVLITMARSSGSVESKKTVAARLVAACIDDGLWSAIIDLSKDNP